MSFLPPSVLPVKDSEPGNSHDTHAIRVENSLFEPVGHIPRRMCSWLAPLVDAGKLRIDGCVPKHTPAPEDGGPSTSLLTLSVFLCKKGKGLLAKQEVRTKLDALHDIVRRTYEDVQNYANADLILELVEGLRPLARQELLPETRLLFPPHPVICTVDFARACLPGPPSYRLLDIAVYLDVADSEDHRALSDSLLLAQVFPKVVAQFGRLQTVGDLFRISRPLNFDYNAGPKIESPVGYKEITVAINEQRTIVMVYDGGTKGAAQRRITPRKIVRSARGAYLIAYCHGDCIEKTYRLDRIREVWCES